MNSFILTGTITNDLELKKSKSDNEYVALIIEVDPRFKGKTETLNCVAFYNLAAECVEKIRKGDRVQLEGYIKHSGNNSTSLILSSFVIISGQIPNNEIEDDTIVSGEYDENIAPTYLLNEKEDKSDISDNNPLDEDLSF